MSGHNRRNIPKPRRHVDQPTLSGIDPISVNWQKGMQDALSRDNSSKIDMNWLAQIGQNGAIASGTGGSVPFVFTKPSSTKGQNEMDSTYSEMLDHNANDGFSQFLSSLGIQQSAGLSGSQRDSWNQYLLQQMLQYYMTQENRDYNRALQLDDRLYNAPTNQLARLMGAGISRDAAIQLLSGASGGSGSGVPYSQAASPADMASANEAGLMPFKAAASVFGMIAQTAGAIGSLGTFGLGAASLATNLAATRATTAGQLLSNSQLQKTLNGIETASTVVGAISSAYQAGIIDKDHNFESSQDMLKYIRDNADKYEPFNSLVSSGALDGISKDVYSLDALNHAYGSWRKSKDYNIDRKHIVSMQALDELFQDINIKGVQQEILQSQQQISESIARVTNTTKLTNADVALRYAQVDLTNFQADNQFIQREMQQMDLDWLTANINDINTVRTNQMMLDAARWNALRDDPEAFDAEVKSWLTDRQNLRSAIAIESYYYSNRLYATEQLSQTAVPFTDLNLAQMACWFHNIFAQTSLPRPNSVSQSERDILGDLSASQVALWALRKYVKMP